MPSVLPVLHFTYSCNDESINQLDKSKKHYSIQQYFFFSRQNIFTGSLYVRMRCFSK